MKTLLENIEFNFWDDCDDTFAITAELKVAATTHINKYALPEVIVPEDEVLEGVKKQLTQDIEYEIYGSAKEKIAKLHSFHERMETPAHYFSLSKEYKEQRQLLEELKHMFSQ